MTCYRPLVGYRAEGGRFTTNRKLSIWGSHTVSVPCGQCIGCRIQRSQEWALRCVHESQYHDANAFLTLTYSDAHLPDDYSVDVRAIQLFMKRLRKEMGHVRYLACGEYGDKTRRPHYHVLLFGQDFREDRRPFSRNGRGDCSFVSDQALRLWGRGHVVIGNLNYATCAYTCRYVMKKINGNNAAEHYRRTHPLTGQVCDVRPEFITMSRRPGIGSAWFEEFGGDAFPSDFLVHDGRKRRVPRFYLKRLGQEDQDKITLQRKVNALEHRENNTPERLAVREEVLASKLSTLKRETE